MFRKEKKAISTLIATVLLILIVVAAVGMIWGIVMPIIQRSTQISQECVNARLIIDTTSGFTCFDSSTNEVAVMVKRGSERMELQGLNLIFEAGGVSKKYNIEDSGSYLDIKTIESNYSDIVILPGKNEGVTYVIDMSSLAGWVPEKVSVVPVIKVGKTATECSPSSDGVIEICAEPLAP